jgi:hypothetical protein
MQESIKEDKFPQFVQSFMDKLFPANDFPQWAVEALASVNIHLKS